MEKDPLTWYTELMVTQNGKEKLQWFFIADLGSNQMILGFPWLHKWNLNIDWRKRTIKGGPISTKTLQTPDWAKIGLLSCQAQYIACNYCLTKDDIVYVQINQVNVVQQWAIEASEDKEPVKVPQEYQDFEDIFSDKKAKQLLPTRGEFDYQIKFKMGAPETIKCKVYPINRAETKFTRNWIQENLASRKIQESLLEITCPSFLIKKKKMAHLGWYRITDLSMPGQSQTTHHSP